MLQPPREKGFWAAVLIGWIVLGAAGFEYAKLKSIPIPAALPLLAAFLFAYPFYLVLGFPRLRERLSPALCLPIAIVPYLIAARFDPVALLKLIALALVIAYWFRLPRNAVTDLLFLALYPAVLLGGYLTSIYVPRVPILRGQTIFLGHFTQIILTILALMVVRRVTETGFGFLPTRREWRIGVVHFLLFAAIGLPLALAIHAIAWKQPAPVWSIAGTFLGFLWVASLSEEFLVRGVLQSWLEKWTGSVNAALLIASVVFGLIHITYGGRFPNWRWVLVATFLGWCCGHARNQAGGIRAGVVTHALAVATWRAFFS